MPRQAYQKISNEDKERLVRCFERGDDYVILAENLGIKRTTAYSIVRRSISGQINKERGGRRTSKVTDEMKEAIISIVENRPDGTLNYINNQLQLIQPQAPRISNSTIANVLKGALIVTKQLRDAPVERNTERTKNERVQFANWLMENLPTTSFIFVDEAGINLWIRRTRGRARRGEQAIRVVHGRRGSNLTMTLAVSPAQGVVYHELQEGGIKERFSTFIQALCQRVDLQDGEGCAIILDNAPAHRATSTMELPPGFMFCFLPPYSPFLNIAENAFSIWKAAVRREIGDNNDVILNEPNHHTRVMYLANIAEVCVPAVTVASMANAFRHMNSYLPRCWARDDIMS